MKCPKCQHENPEDAKFCIECANPMEFHCPKCGVITPATGKFCKECGHQLSQPKEAPPSEPSPMQCRFSWDVLSSCRILPSPSADPGQTQAIEMA